MTVKCSTGNWKLIGSGDETWILRKADQTHPERFEMWCWRWVEISLADRVGNEEVLQRVEEERNSLFTVNRRKVNWIGHILHRNTSDRKTRKKR
jgi:hypothetical protein